MNRELEFESHTKKKKKKIKIKKKKKKKKVNQYISAGWLKIIIIKQMPKGLYHIYITKIKTM